MPTQSRKTLALLCTLSVFLGCSNPNNNDIADNNNDIAEGKKAPLWQLVAIETTDLLLVNKIDASTVSIGKHGQTDIQYVTYDRNAKILYGLNFSAKIYKIDVCNGETSVLGSVSLATQTLFRMESMAVDPRDGTLYGAGSIDDDGTSETLMTIDPADLSATIIATITGTADTNDADRMLIHNDTLYITDTYGKPFETDLYTLDWKSNNDIWEANLINTVLPARAHIRSITYDPDTGKVFASDGDAMTLLTLDLQTAQTSLVGPMPAGNISIAVVDRSQCSAP